MTNIIIKKRRTLSLPKKTTAVLNVTKPTREELDVIEMGIKNQRYQDCKIWICSRWPAMFDRDNVKPLALGIYRDIAIKHKEDGGFEVLGFGAVPVKRFLSAWVKRKAYQRALSQFRCAAFQLTG
ncbi:hypothetical protein ACU5EH_24745 [Aliivibrio salmonicida]|uniref:hypothetical protein n=1 Tax=Aliivibrio salmonicida TaxID=40269 RepID=UPI00406C0194